MADVYYDMTWGRIRLFAARVSTDNSRSVIVQERATGDVHPAQDRGARPRRTRCELLFVEMPDETKSPLARFLLFKAQVDRGDEEVFTHPVEGAFVAKVGEFTYDIDDDSNLSNVMAEFIPSDDVLAVHPTAPGTTGMTTFESAAAAIEQLATELEAVGIESDLPERASEAVEEWTSGETVPTRDVMNDTAALTGELGDLIEDEGLEDDLELFAAWQAVVMCGSAIRDAALAVTSETASIFVLRVAVSTSLLALVVRIYGGADAENRERQVRALNDLRTPGGMIQAGTDLVMPAVDARRAS